MKRRIAILGSTGSIGQQALEVIGGHPDLLQVEVLTANHQVELLIAQALAHRPRAVVIGNSERYPLLRDALAHLPIAVHAGADALAQVVQADGVDMVLTAMVGYSGLAPTLAAVAAGKPIALANKEVLVVAGELVMALARERGVPVLPVDSEHSAIFQCLVGEQSPIERIILTASGGPFRSFTPDQLARVAPCDALRHPNWCMGSKITIDSATLMNKGFEVIEAQWLFGLRPEQIEVVVHPQSIIHSMVQFEDSSIKAQMGLPDMRLPIQYALAYPHRLKSTFPRFSFSQVPCFTFEPPDTERFPALALARLAMVRGGNAPCALNAANEVAVEAFLSGKIGFPAMAHLVRDTLEATPHIAHPTLAHYLETDREARARAMSIIRSGVCH